MIAISSVMIAVAAIVVAILTWDHTRHFDELAIDLESRVGAVSACIAWADYVESLDDRKVPLAEIDRRGRYFTGAAFDADGDITQLCGTSAGIVGRDRTPPPITGDQGG